MGKRSRKDETKDSRSWKLHCCSLNGTRTNRTAKQRESACRRMEGPSSFSFSFYFYFFLHCTSALSDRVTSEKFSQQDAGTFALLKRDDEDAKIRAVINLTLPARHNHRFAKFHSPNSLNAHKFTPLDVHGK